MTTREPALPYVHQVTKYDPADRDERGHYTGSEDVSSDHGPVEAAYLAAVAAFAEDSGVTEVAIREPAVAGMVNFGVEPLLAGHGLDGLFPSDLTGYHDGALVPVGVAVELVRAMLRDNGAWCRLEVDGRFLVHIGYDQYMYVGSSLPCTRAVDLAHERGLFAERIPASPYEHSPDDEDGPARPADAEFWAELAALVADRGAVLLEEGYVHNAARWHRVTGDLAAIRARLAPRARLSVWPDLSPDVQAALADLPDGLTELVWRDRHGTIRSRNVYRDEDDPLAVVGDADGVLVLSCYADDRTPLLSAVLPDPDGVLRARWTP